MHQLWPMDNFSDTEFNALSRNMGDIATALTDLCRFAPNLFNIIGSDFERYPIERGKALIFQQLRDKVIDCNTVADVAKLCIDLCSPYKYPLFDSVMPSYDFVNASCLDTLFKPEQFAQESLNYLVLQYLYVYQPINSEIISEKDFKRIKGKFQTQKSALLNLYSDKNFDYSRIDSYLSNAAKMTLNPKESGNIDLLNINNSLYDFVLAAGLYTTPMRWNPYVKNFIQITASTNENNNINEIRFKYNDDIGISNVFNWDDVIQAKINAFDRELKRLKRLIKAKGTNPDKKEQLKNKLSYMINNKPTPEEHLNSIKAFISKFPNLKMNCDMLQNFVNHFYLREIEPLTSGKNFISVASYIAERITHYNFINFVYNIFERTGHNYCSNLSIMAIYPLVSYRLMILDSLQQYMISNPDVTNDRTYFKSCISSIKSTENAFPIEQFHMIIKYQSLFYFPLLTRLFHNLLFLKCNNTNSELHGLITSSDNFILQDNICHLFDFDSKSSKNQSKKSNTNPIEVCKCKQSNRFVTLKTISGRERIKAPTSIYDTIQNETYKMYYEQVFKLRNYNFIDDGFKHLDKNFQFVKDLEKELDLTLINQCLDWDDDADSPLYINF